MKTFKEYYKERLMEMDEIRGILAKKKAELDRRAQERGALESEHAKKFMPGEIPTVPLPQNTQPTDNGYGTPMPNSGGMKSISRPSSTTPITKTQPSSGQAPDRGNMRKVRPWEVQ